MFQIGDQIVHPLHGAGVVQDIVERTIDGAPVQYYALQLALDDTALFLPVSSCSKLGIRPVCTRAQAEALLHRMDGLVCGEDKGWNQRCRENMQLLRSGEPLKVAQVVKSLAGRDRARGLSAGEKQMLASARQIVSSELAFALGIPPEQADVLVDTHLHIE
ncbi:MAG: CarD family transcriptional regulator [Agathobaculum sp.]|uniref:CarD family transcriptional regulator n=1 Tax=Agathobaculum sp. TaxID=2048138 RepID=UPI0025C5606B|nr:CarD family transcriptional regulator [Agathobaculum sp.]MCI7126299.1 CarD family transcriptional regulator [Agathobaculum sp.]